MAGRLLWFQRNDSRRLNLLQIIKFSNKMNPKRQQIQPIIFQHRRPLQLFDYLYLSLLFVRNAESMEFTTCPLIKIIICLFLLASPWLITEDSEIKKVENDWQCSHESTKRRVPALAFPPLEINTTVHLSHQESNLREQTDE